MSELKAYKGDIYIPVYGSVADAKVYLKSEADKVIAELNAQVDFLKTTHDSCGNCNSCADGIGKVLNEQLDELKKKLIGQTTLRMWAEMQLHHNKYKRCLAMARRCHNESLWWYSKGYGFEKYDKFWEKWEKRWMKLAEKFKEAK